MSKTITLKSNNVSLYVFDDSETVTMESNKISVGDPLKRTIGDLNSTNAELHTGVTVPSGWIGWKHTYDGRAWGDVSGWVDHRAAILEGEKARYAADSFYSSTFTTAIQTEIDRIKALQCLGGGHSE